MQTFVVGGKTVSIFESGASNAPVIYLNTVSGEGQQVFEQMQKMGCAACTLVAVSDLDWNRDMSPWDSPPIFKQTPPCTGGADAYLRVLTEEIIPTAEKKIGGNIPWRGLAGYSLAGLFAVYAMYQTELFSRIGSMSGSLWFPGMKEYVFSHEPKCWPDCIYFSLGDKENKTRNRPTKYRRNTGILSRQRDSNCV